LFATLIYATSQAMRPNCINFRCCFIASPSLWPVLYLLHCVFGTLKMIWPVVSNL